MSKISPSEQLDKELHALLWGGEESVQDTGSILSALMRKAVAKVIQEALEGELTEFLGRDRYERRGNDDPETPGYRNGYKDRVLKTAEGAVKVGLPQARNTAAPYRSKLWEFLRGRSDMLETLVVEMYARGMSMRDIEDAFTDDDGVCLLSKSQASELTDSLKAEYRAFTRRDLSVFDVVYLFIDAVYEPMRRIGRTKEAILCCWGITGKGEKILIHMDTGERESYAAWKSFTSDLVRRGLPTPLTVTTDGAGGLTRAVEETWCQSIRIRCWKHKMDNVLAKVRKESHAEVKEYLRSIRDAPDWATGQQLAARFIEKFEAEYGRAVNSFREDLEATLAHLQLPAVHRIHIRTSNLIERAFEEQRRRTKVIPRFMSEESALKLTYATLWRVSQRWNRVRFSEHEQRQIQELKKRRGLLTENETDTREEPDNLAG